MFNLSSLIFLYILFKYNINNQNVSLKEEDSMISKIENKDIISYKSNENPQNSGQLNNKYSNIKRKLSPSKKNLILGAVTNYKWEIVQPFFKSFEAVGFENCDCVIFVAKISESTINKIQSCGVIIKYFPKEYENMIANKIRYKMYLDFLNENKDRYNIVLHVDVRDTIFQQDFFQLYDIKKPFLGVALEDGLMNERYNKEWFIFAFGQDLYKKVENERIICSGTIWGTADKFLQLTSLIWERVKNGCNNLRWHDQTQFIYIIYIEKIFDDCLIKTNNKEGNVFTLALVNNVSLDSENNILTEKGEIAALVHQYDRIKYLIPIVKKKYCIEGKVNLTKKYKKKGKFFNIKSFIIFPLFLLIIIIVVFFTFRPIFKRKVKKSGYKRYKNKKFKKMTRYSMYKFKF